ncbi:MAG: succinylglutamate desuccinylase/aspartoacylase family protein [Pyrinomonadaceae bacterium]
MIVTDSTATKSTEPEFIAEGEHLVAHFKGPEDGPTLIVFGSIHGNERSGVTALRNVAAELAGREIDFRGNIWFLAGNTRALNRNERFVETDLNRHWTFENASQNRSGSDGTKLEDREQTELLKFIDEVFGKARNEVFALDLHSTSSESTPFAMIGDTLRNRNFAEKFPVTFLLGIEEQIDGTIMEYMNELGCVTLGFEAGQHFTDEAVRNQEALVRLALVNSGVVPAGVIDEAANRGELERATGGRRIIEIRYRHAINAEDEFEMRPGYENFQEISKGEFLATEKGGKVFAPESGMILMPLYQKLGNDGFFVGREIKPFWLRVSRFLRTLRIGRFMKYLPGVAVDPTNSEALIVNTNIASILPLQIFHLLGFRKRRWRGEKLVVSRRHHDKTSPFLHS